MKKFYKSILILNIIFYFDVILLSLNLSKHGIEATNPFWLMSPYIFVFLYLGYVKIFHKKERMVYIFIYIIKIVTMLLGYVSGKYSLMSSQQAILFVVLLFVILVSSLIEYKFISVVKNSIEDREKDYPSLTIEDLAMIESNKELRDMLMTARNISFKVQFHTFGIILSYVIIVMSIIFISDLNTKSIGYIILGLSVVLISIIFYQFFEYFSKKNSQARIISIGFVLFGLSPYSLLLFPNIILQSSEGWLFVVLAIFAIPVWYFYKKEAELLWKDFLLKFKKIKED